LSTDRLPTVDIQLSHVMGAEYRDIDVDAATAVMSTSLAEYLSALESRDAREQAHQVYLEACKCCQSTKHEGVDEMQTPSWPTASQEDHE
jgi:hypothetical protein